MECAAIGDKWTWFYSVVNCRFIHTYAPTNFEKFGLGLSSSQINYWRINLHRCSPGIIITDVLLDGLAVSVLLIRDSWRQYY